MNPSRTFILRPVATSLLMVAILLAGAVAFRQLPVSALPEVDYPTIQVITFYPGASPDVMASSVTAPLERQFGQVPGLQQMTSTSSDGSSVITLQFNLSLNIDVAEQEVQQSINAAGTYLPADLPMPPIYSKTNPADAPILTLALTSEDDAAVEGGGSGRHAAGAEDLAVARRRPGEHQRRAEAGGAHSGQPHALASYGLNLEDVRSAIAAANVNQAKGNFDGPQQSYRSAPTISCCPARITRRDRGLPQRRAGEAVRRGRWSGRRRKHQPGRVDEPDAGGDRQYPAPARRQHHRRGGPHQDAAAAA